MKPWIALVIGVLIGWLIGWLLQIWYERRKRPGRLEIPREPLRAADREAAQVAAPATPQIEAPAAPVIAAAPGEVTPEILPQPAPPTSLEEVEHEAPPEVDWAELHAQVAAQQPLVAPDLDRFETPAVEEPAAVIGATLAESPDADLAPESSAAAPLPDEALAALEPTPDDLIVIEGIGPVYAAKLNAAGITTFARLAASTPQELAAIIQAPSWRRMYFEEWIEQAELLRDHEDARLKELQDRLFRRKKA